MPWNDGSHNPYSTPCVVLNVGSLARFGLAWQVSPIFAQGRAEFPMSMLRVAISVIRLPLPMVGVRK